MKLLMNTDDTNHQKMNEATSSLRYLSHENEPENQYRNHKLKDNSRHRVNNLSGFLDDADITFNYWFCVASKFLKNH